MHTCYRHAAWDPHTSGGAFRSPTRRCQGRLSVSGRWVQCVRCRVQGVGFRVQGVGFRVQGVGFRVQGSGCKVSLLRAPSFLGRSKLPAICRAWAVGSVQRFRGGLKAYRLCVSLSSGLESNKEEKKKVRELLGP